MKNVEKILESTEDIEFYPNADLSKKSTMKLKARGDLIIVRSVAALEKLIKRLNTLNMRYKILGMGANQLLPETSSEPYIKLDFSFDRTYLEEKKEIYELPASLSLAVLTSHAVKFSIKGWEVFTGIPATIGGAVAMNAGTGLGEIGPLIKEVLVVTREGKTRTIQTDKNSFSYRSNNFLNDGDIVVSVKMITLGVDKKIPEEIRSYLEKRNNSQPLKENTCGCIFKNKQFDKQTCRAGHYIDIIGLKGFTYKGVRVSPLHANFMENSEGATYTDVLNAIKIIQSELDLHFGIEFETEVKV